MTYSFAYKSEFVKSVDHLDENDQLEILKIIGLVREWIQTGRVSSPYGLRVKKLRQHAPTVAYYEARLNIHTRIVWRQSEDAVLFSLLGNHDDVRRFLKNL